MDTGGEMSSDVEKVLKRSPEYSKTLIGGSLCLYGHVEENRESWESETNLGNGY